MNVPPTIDLDKVDGPVAVEISGANAAAFKGRVTDAKGRPLAGAKAALHHHMQGVGRQSRYSSSTVTATAATDADGRYGFAAQWPGDDYRVAVTAAGFANAEGKQFRGEAGKTHELDDVKLTRSSLVVRGTVAGPDGKPAAGAEVFSVDGQDRASTTSAADGSFALDGCPETPGFVFARKAGFKLAVLLVAAGDGKPVRLTLAAADGKPVPPPEISAQHRAALAAATRHALTLVWDSDATFGYGSNALVGMAKFDPATAAKWRDAAKERTGGKTDFTRLLGEDARQKTLFDTAKADPDEALAAVAGMAADAGFHEAARVGELMLAVDKATALRFAEEAVVKARQIRLPDRVWSLARAGDLAVRAGNAAGGKKVLAEAADLAAKLTPDVNGRNSLAVGLAAAHLAPHDAAKADQMLDTLTDPGDYNRYLAAAAGRVARVDLGRAKALLGRFKPSNTYSLQEARQRVAYAAVAAGRPDEAVQMIDAEGEAVFRYLGYVRLATLFAPTDKPRAYKMIDTAFDFLEREPNKFLNWNGNSPATFAAVGIMRAKELGYPDVPQLVVRCLALRPAADGRGSPDTRADVAVNLAGAVALVDPATARQILATVGSPEGNARAALSKSRNWLFNLTLADPERAPALADSLLAQAKKLGGGGNAISRSGLVELGTVLTAPDTLAALAMYGNLPRELPDHE